MPVKRHALLTEPQEPRKSLAETGRRTFVVVERGESYRLECPGVDLVFIADRLVWKHHELFGELTVECPLLGTDAVNGILSAGAFNFSSVEARVKRGALLAKAAAAPTIPFAALLEDLCQKTIAEERVGEPHMDLADVPLPTIDEQVVNVSGFALPRQHPSCLFGDGGSCKSYLALHIAGLMADVGYRVGLFDWELDAADHRLRYGKLFTQMPRGIAYVKCRRPLIHEMDGLKRTARTLGLDYAIYDSVGFACHDAPEAAVSALQYFQAVRQIGVGSLHIAHVTKSEGGDQKPFGSAFWHNSCRATWFIKGSEDRNPLSLAIHQRKANLSGRQRAFQLDVEFTAQRTIIQTGDIRQHAEHAKNLPLHERILSALTESPQTVTELAARADGTKSSIDRYLRGYVKSGRVLRFPGLDEPEYRLNSDHSEQPELDAEK